jgi:AraC-like DNA-binding protein
VSTARQIPRRTAPELERDLTRSTDLGYEDPTEVGVIRCLSHGFPTPLARWHYHDEYELHLITATSGKVFVGDWIGPFQPGHLVLTGPRLPHNWISMDLPEGGTPLRDLVIQFPHEPLAQAAQAFPEVRELLPLLERAKNGIEFFGLGERAQSHWHQVKSARGLARFAAFCEFLTDLARCTDYRLLSNVQLQSVDDDDSLDQIDTVLNRLTDDLSRPVSAAELAEEMGMTESRFSRFFRRATGNTFTDFVNRVRVQRACQLLMESDQLITHICFEVGFNNVANFNRRFLEIKGMTPSEFRKQSIARMGLGLMPS